MQICGFNKTTLLDYPGHVAATIFTGCCNFRCPFCQNGDLVLHPARLPQFDETEILKVLSKRRGILTGVCITGGEPTLQPDLAVYLAVPFGLPVLCVGFLKYQGMTPVELVKEMVFEYRTKFLLYDAEEVPEPQIFTMESIIHSGIDRKEWKRLRKKHKKRKGQ